MVAHLGQMVGLFLHEAVHGVGVDVFILGQVQRLVKVVHAGRAGHEPAAVRLLAEVLRGLVVFVPDLAHKLFQNVLEGDDALGVNGVVIDGQAGIAGFCECLRKLFQRNIVLHGHHVYAGRQDLFHLHVIELDGAADELAFPVGELTVVLSLAHHGDELTFGDGVALAAVDEASQQLLPLAEQPGEKLVVLLGHRQHPGGGSVAFLSAAFQAYLVQGRKCGLGGGEECGKRDQNDQRHQERYTAIVHNKG